jgi:hypothetical protein
MPEGQIKGAAFREFLRWCDASLGRERLVEVAESLPASVRAHLETDAEALGVLTSVWYPASVVHALLDGLTMHMSPAEQRRLADEGAAAVMSATLKGVYKLLFDWMATPARYARFSPKLWASYYDCGTFEVTQRDDNQAVCTISEWETHHPFMCDLNRGAATAIYSAMGCKDADTEREQCVAKGDPHCRFVTRWKA